MPTPLPQSASTAPRARPYAQPCWPSGLATLDLLVAIHVLMGIVTAGVALASGNIVMKLSPAGQATAFLAASIVVRATCGAVAPVIGGFVPTSSPHSSSPSRSPGRAAPTRSRSVQVLSFHSCSFFFGLAFVVGLFSLHRLCFVRETAGTTDKLLVRDLLIEARRSIQSLSSAAGLPRVVLPQSWLVPPRSGKLPAIGRVID
jgi:hypothetical protein